MRNPSKTIDWRAATQTSMLRLRKSRSLPVTEDELERSVALTTEPAAFSRAEMLACLLIVVDTKSARIPYLLSTTTAFPFDCWEHEFWHVWNAQHVCQFQHRGRQRIKQVDKSYREDDDPDPDALERRDNDDSECGASSSSSWGLVAASSSAFSSPSATDERLRMSFNFCGDWRVFSQRRSCTTRREEEPLQSP